MTQASRTALRRLAHRDGPGALAALAAPGDADDHAVLGMVHLDAGRWDAARTSLAQACAWGDVSPVTLLNLALAEDRLFPDGRERLLALADAHPHWDEPRLRLAESFRRAGEAESAKAQYRLALGLNPDRLEALLGLGAMLLTEGDAAAAQPLLRRCCGLAPDNAEAWDAFGIALGMTGQSGTAEAAFAKAQALRPSSLTIALRRATAAFAAG